LDNPASATLNITKSLVVPIKACSQCTGRLMVKHSTRKARASHGTDTWAAQHAKASGSRICEVRRQVSRVTWVV